MAHVDKKAFLDPQETQRLELFFKTLQTGVAAVRTGAAGKHINTNRVLVRFEIQNLVDCQVAHLAAGLNGEDFAFGGKLLCRLRKVGFQLHIDIGFQKIPERAQFILLRCIFHIVGNKNEDCVISFLPQPPRQINSGAAPVSEINVQKGNIIGLQNKAAQSVPRICVNPNLSLLLRGVLREQALQLR